MKVCQSVAYSVFLNTWLACLGFLAFLGVLIHVLLCLLCLLVCLLCLVLCFLKYYYAYYVFYYCHDAYYAYCYAQYAYYHYNVALTLSLTLLSSVCSDQKTFTLFFGAFLRCLLQLLMYIFIKAPCEAPAVHSRSSYGALCGLIIASLRVLYGALTESLKFVLNRTESHSSSLYLSHSLSISLQHFN